MEPQSKAEQPGTKTIRQAVTERGDDWASALDEPRSTIHMRNECFAIVGSNAERCDFYRMRTIAGHPSESVRAAYRNMTL